MKEKSILSRFGIVVLILLALVLIFPSAKIDLNAKLSASTTASVRTEHLQNFASSTEMDYQVLASSDPVYQQITALLSGVKCTRRFNQNYSSYSHEFPVDSITLSFYDDAEQHQLLFTVYSDDTSIVNSEFVTVRYSGGGAAELYQALAEIVN